MLRSVKYSLLLVGFLSLAAACGVSEPSTPSPTPTQPPRTPSALEKVLALTPASFADQPLEFADYRGSLVSQGFKGYSTLDDEVLLELILEMGIEESRQGRSPWKGLSLVPIGVPLKPEQMGLPEELAHRAFDLGIWLYYWPFGVAPSAGFGTPPRSAFLNIQGRYQKEEMDAKLLAFGPETGGPESGYEKLDYQGVTYYALYEDYTEGLLYPRRAGIFNRIALVDDWLLAAPATDPLEALIDMHQGKGASLLESRPHRKLAQVADEGLLGGVFRDASVIEDSEGHFIRRSDPIYKRYLDGFETTQALSPYDLTLTGYRMREGVEEIVIALYYPDPEAAQRDRAELEHRWNTLTVNFGSASVELMPLIQLCAPLTTQVVEGQDYSMLIGICPMKRGQLPDAIMDLPFLWRGAPHWLLYPDLEELKSTLEAGQ